jgi:outer membrane protein OmpA-like peptidoglycan-associated protein
MRKFLFAAVAILFTSALTYGQTPVSAIPKDAKIEGTIIDMRKRNPLPNELVVFKSSKNSNEYQAISDDNGKFNTRLPSGDKYEIFILGFKDSTSYNFIEIPSLKANETFPKPFTVSIEYEAAKTFVLDDVNFEYKKADLRPESFKALNELVEYLTRRPTDRIEIGGHTDNIGGDAYNQKLSEARAKSVVDYLISKGIDATRLTFKGYGATMPIEENDTEAGRAKNRRTEVKVLD